VGQEAAVYVARYSVVDDRSTRDDLPPRRKLVDWLRELIERVTSILPRIRIISAYESGVMFTLGRYVKALRPGWYIQWPWFQEFEYMDVQSQPVDLRCQSAYTKDGVDVVVGGGVQYRITDIVKAVCNITDVDDSLGKVALGTILKYVNKRDFKDCHNVEDLEYEILKGLRKDAAGWGVKIERVFITDFGKTINLRMI
jgi:regulator of protease activity HflC (stomatin/prohibitin superfamily)